MEGATSSNPPLASLSPDMLAAIQHLVDQKVEEKWSKFQEEYEEVLTKMKKQIAANVGKGLIKTAVGAKKEEKKEPEETSISRPTTAKPKPVG